MEQKVEPVFLKILLLVLILAITFPIWIWFVPFALWWGSSEETL